MKSTLKGAVAVAVLIASAQAMADITFFERENFRGQSFTTDRPMRDLTRFGFNDRAESAIVRDRPWEVCDDARFGGRCKVLRPGSYPSLRAMHMNDRISSVRDLDRNARFEEGRYAPQPVAAYEPPRREDRLYEANVTSARAVVGAQNQRCWVEQQRVQNNSQYNVPGALVGAVIGGVLGHQIGRGTGRDVATVGGAVAGGAVGANVGRRDDVATTQDVQRCENIPGSGRTEYWDVTYNFRGQEHHAQVVSPPGATILVNENGEPRV